MKSTLLTSACSIILAGQTPDWIELMPLGPMTANDGRKWTLANAQVVIDTSGDDLAIDYDHSTDLEKGTLAAGWIKTMEVRDGSIWGRVEWTPKAAAHLENKEFRFLSPVFTHTKAGDVTRILRAALTNNPALDLTALAHSQNSTINKEHDMDPILLALLQALGLDDNATQETALAALNAKLAEAQNTGKGLRTALCATLKLGDDATDEGITTAIASLQSAQGSDAGNPDPDKYVPRAMFDELQTSVTSMQEQTAGDKAEVAVDTAIAAGKLPPANKGWGLDYASKDLAGFNTFIGNQPKVLTESEILDGKVPGGDGGLSADEKAVCVSMGITEDDFKKTRDEEAA